MTPPPEKALHREDGGEVRTPNRRCICCRGNGKKAELLRFVVFNGELCFDLRKKMPGRGYYVCAQMHCLEKAMATGFKRVIKGGVRVSWPNAQAFTETVLLPGLRKRYVELLQSGYRSRQLMIGSDCVEEAAKADALGCYILAVDASASTRKKYGQNAERKGVPCVGLLDRSDYGRLFGKSDKVVLGFLSGELCEAFLHVESSIRRLSGMAETRLEDPQEGSEEDVTASE